MPLAAALGMLVAIAVAAAWVVARRRTFANRTTTARPKPARSRPFVPARSRPAWTGSVATIIAVLVLLPAVLHLLTLVRALFADPQSPLYSLMRWLSRF